MGISWVRSPRCSKKGDELQNFPFLKEENDDEHLDCLYTLFLTKIWSRMIDEKG